MSLVSLLYLMMLSYAMTPLLYAQIEEDDQELQQDFDEDEMDEPEQSTPASLVVAEQTMPATKVEVAPAEPAKTDAGVQQNAQAQQPATPAPAITAPQVTPTTEPQAQATPSEQPKPEQPNPEPSKDVSQLQQPETKTEGKAEVKQPTEQPAAMPAPDAKPQETPAPQVAQTTPQPEAKKEESKKEEVAAPVVPEAAAIQPAQEVTKSVPTKAETTKEEKPAEQAQQPPTPEPKKEETAVTPTESKTTKPAASKKEEKAPEQPQTKPESAPVQEVKAEIPPLPEPPKPVELTLEQRKKAMAEIEQGEIKGIDTVDVESPEGNWLFKRIWWDKSNNLYDKIRTTLDQINEARAHFEKLHTRVDAQLEKFYTSIGFTQGQLSEIADHLLEQLDKKRKKKGMLDSDELEYYTTIANAKTTIESFTAAVQSVEQLANDQRNALVTLIDQVNRARAYESEARRLLKAIALELDDKKAREYYYGVITQWENIKAIDVYIAGPYSTHFDLLVNKTLKEKLKEIEDALQQLKDKGIKYEQMVQNYLENKEEACPQPEPVTEKKPKGKQGWWSWLMSFFS